MGSMGLEVIMGPVTENRVVPVHHGMCEYTIIPSLPRPIEHRVPLNPRTPLRQGQGQGQGQAPGKAVQVDIRLTLG